MFKRSVLVVLIMLLAIGATAYAQDDEGQKVTVTRKSPPPKDAGVPAAQLEAARKAREAGLTPAPEVSPVPTQVNPDAGVPVKIEAPKKELSTKTKVDDKPASDVSVTVADVEPVNPDPSLQIEQVLCYVKGDPSTPSPCQIERILQLQETVRALEAQRVLINKDIGKLANAAWGANPFPEGNELAREANVVVDGMSTSERKEQASDNEPWVTKLARLEQEVSLMKQQQDGQLKETVLLELSYKSNEAQKATSQPVTASVSKKKQGAAQSHF